jgi:hypothetical protein
MHFLYKLRGQQEPKEKTPQRNHSGDYAALRGDVEGRFTGDGVVFSKIWEAVKLG